MKPTRVAVEAPIGNSDHSSLSAVISMAPTVPNLCMSREVFLKLQVNWNTVCGAIRELPWRNIWLSDNPVEVLNEHLSLLVERYAPTKVIRVCNMDKSWFDDQCRHAFGLKEEALYPYGGTGPLGMFPLFLKSKLLMLWPPS